MLKLHQHFFINFFLISIVILVVSGVVSFFTLKKIELKSFEDSLLEDITIVEAFFKKNDSIYESIKEISKNAKIRITIVDMSGIVVAESDFDKDEMQNHLDRPEIIQANAKEYGSSIRYSNTINSNLLYVAKKTTINDKQIFIRTARSIEDINKRFIHLWLQVAGIFALAVLLALFISYVFSKKIKKEIEQIKEMLESIEQKEFKIKPFKFIISEFMQISSVIRVIAKKIAKKEKQKRKFEAKLRLKTMQQQDIMVALSHEFKNPIAVILGYCQTLNKDVDMPKETRVKFLQKIDKNAQKISAMLDRLSLVAKMESQNMVVNAKYFDIKDLASDVKNMLEDKYKNRKVEIEGSARNIMADRTLIELVLVNLCDNALKYSSENIKIIIDSEKVSVEDKGLGISKDEIENISKKFYRIKNNEWDNSLGLGLTIVSYILKLHNSKLLVSSSEGAGSTFSFFI